MAAYKRCRLKSAEPGFWRSHEYAHILSRNQRCLNILPTYRERFFKSCHTNIQYHSFFAHLNSSQGLCINLFFPLIAEEKLGAITRFLEIKSDCTPLPTFEKPSELEMKKVLEMEKVPRPTNFDFHLRYGAAEEVYFEIKYSERNFAKAPNDEAHRDKFRQIYQPLLQGASNYLLKGCNNCDFFLEHYQLLRNLVHLAACRT
jgi:hypothetical protein